MSSRWKEGDYWGGEEWLDSHGERIIGYHGAKKRTSKIV